MVLKMTDNHNNNRREFLQNTIRLLVLGILGFGTGALMMRHSEQCGNAGICRGCASFHGCGLPQALSAKAALARGEAWQKTTKK